MVLLLLALLGAHSRGARVVAAQAEAGRVMAASLMVVSIQAQEALA